MKVTVVVGNPKPRSRTRQVAEALTNKLVRPSSDVRVIDLADHLAVFANPTYKATFTGILKGFLDRYPAAGLTGVTAIPALTGRMRRTRWAPRCTSRRCWSSWAHRSRGGAGTS
ncbi:NADPH-dependent FMN reductase [Amycolatopsis pithecellobii]|uniref:NADPH-dependent FMN reductase n=1 Tax=Amycolatopsis pithecellobii TaxID=664692 RepID=UPI001AA0AFCF